MAVAELSGLPPELLLRVTDHLTTRQLLPLSATNSSFRECLLPVVFSVLRVTNRWDEANIALRLAKKHSQYITTLSFEGYASPAENGRATRTRTWGPKGTSTLPVATRALLKGEYLPKLRTARVHFAFDYASEDWSVDPSTGGRNTGFYDFDAAEFDEQIEQREPKWKWRALMAETWMTLAQNSHIETLEIVDLPPRGTTAFIAPAFQAFLGRLRKLSLSIWGAAKEAGWKIETFPGYPTFLSCMHGWLFQQLSSSTAVKLSASSDGLPGLTGTLTVGMALTQDSLPALSILELCRIAIDQTLVSFISAHAVGLRSLSFDRCLCTPNTVFGGIEAKDAVRWSSLFRLLQHMRFNLTALEILPLVAPIAVDDADVDEGPEDVRTIRSDLQDDPHLRVFGYGELSEWEGSANRDHELNIQAFMLGDDMREYDALMEVIADNVKAKT